MARRRNRFHKIELHNIVIGLTYLACGVNCLLGALVMFAKGKELYELLIGGILALMMAFVWFFTDPFTTSRPWTTLNDVAVVAVMVLALNGLLIWACWPMIFAVALEAFFIIRFYLNNRRRRH